MGQTSGLLPNELSLVAFPDVPTCGENRSYLDMLWSFIKG